MREQCAKPFYADVRILERSDKNSAGGKIAKIRNCNKYKPINSKS